MNVSIIGTTGYGGAELLRILKQHPEFNIKSIHSTKDDIPIWHEYPHLYGILEKNLEGIDSAQIADQSDIVFLATPSGISGKLAEDFSGKDIKIIDLSGDLRIPAQDYMKWYKHTPANETLVEKAVYGLSEWHHDEIASAEIISNPGCYPTAALLSLAPVVNENLIKPDSIVIDAKSGVSGAGRALTRNASYAEANENMRVYKVNQHQHTPEIEQQLMRWNSALMPITFTTHLLPITRGIMTTSYVQLTSEYTSSQILELYQSVYENHPFIRIRPENTFPSIKEVAGSNFCDIGVHADSRTGRLTIISVIDNLMKGAAGQAVQNANIMSGCDETAGLGFVPLYP